MDKQQSQSTQSVKELDIQALLIRFLHNWYWIALCMVTGFVLAFLYLRYTDDVFSTKANIRILDNKETAEINIDLDKMMSRSSINLENEMAVLKSFRINRMVAKRLKSNITYFKEGKVKRWQMYKAPFEVTHVQALDSSCQFRQFKILVQPNAMVLTNQYEETLTVSGHVFETPNARFPITVIPKNGPKIPVNDEYPYVVNISSLDAAARQLAGSLKIELYGEFSDILTLSFNSYNTAFSEDYINTLVEVYIDDGISDRQQISRRTIEFIDERFTYLSTELDSIENRKQTYKQDNDLSIFSADAGSVLRNQQLKEDLLFKTETQLLLSDVLENSLTKNDDFKLLPADIGLTSTSVNDLVGKYNEALLEYNKLKSSAGSQNPTVKILRQSIVELNKNIAVSIDAYQKQLEETLAQNQKAQGIVARSFKSIPVSEKVLRGIERQQSLKESLYILLLQKREEAAIEMAIMAPNVKVVDYAMSNPVPVSPLKKRVYLVGLMLGMSLPLGIIFLVFILDTKVYDRKGIEMLHKGAMVIGEVPEHKNEQSALTDMDDHVAESYRTLAHNLFLSWSNDDLKGKIVCVTSGVKGEGKTNIAYNLARFSGQLEKKVLLLGADLRNPQLHSLLGVDKNHLGLSNFLVSDNIDWQSCVIKDSNSKNLDIILSGEISPLPSILLTSDKFKKWMKGLRESYDLIIIDTAPTLLVSDTLTFIKDTDAVINVVRSGLTKTHVIKHTMSLEADKKIPELFYVVNAISLRTLFGYGYGYRYNYGYGYGYGAENLPNKPWYRFW